MKVYVAAPWAHKAEARTFAEALKAAGHTVTYPWWEHRDTQDVVELRQQAQEDQTGVLNAHVFVLLNLCLSTGGKEVESGIALTKGLRCFLVGKRSNVFHYLPQWTIVDSLDAVLYALDFQM